MKFFFFIFHSDFFGANSWEALAPYVSPPITGFTDTVFLVSLLPPLLNFSNSMLWLGLGYNIVFINCVWHLLARVWPLLTAVLVGNDPFLWRKTKQKNILSQTFWSYFCKQSCFSFLLALLTMDWSDNTILKIMIKSMLIQVA